jgi:hypothetical protein
MWCPAALKEVFEGEGPGEDFDLLWSRVAQVVDLVWSQVAQVVNLL